MNEIIRHLGSGMIRPFAQNIWDLSPPVSVEFDRGQHGKAWAPPNTLGRILARVLHAETVRMARCPLLARILHAETTRTACCPKAVKTKNSGAFPLSLKTSKKLKNHEQQIITVAGKAFYDLAHAPADHSNRRASPKDYAVWEIYPVMALQVVQ